MLKIASKSSKLIGFHHEVTGKVTNNEMDALQHSYRYGREEPAETNLEDAKHLKTALWARYPEVSREKMVHSVPDPVAFSDELEHEVNSPVTRAEILTHHLYMGAFSIADIIEELANEEFKDDSYTKKSDSATSK